MDLTPDFTNNDVWEGLIAGIFLGIMLGTSWEKAYELFEQAYEQRQERRAMSTHRETSGDRPNIAVRFGRWFKNLPPIGLILCVATANMLALGVFQVWNYTRMTNFIQCEAQFSQNSSVARNARANANTVETNALYIWIETLPPLLAAKGNPTPRQQELFRHTLELAIDTYERNLRIQQSHPYPPNPEDTCGTY